MPSSKFLNSVDIAGSETVSGSEHVILDISVGNNLTVAGGLTANSVSIVTDISAAQFYGDGAYLTNVIHDNDYRLTNSRTPTGSAGGDLSGTYPDPAVAKIQGVTVSTATPVNGQMLQYNGTAWVPASVPTGGSGGGGLTFFLNQGLSAQAPTTNLPLTAHELGRTALSAQTDFTSPDLSQVDYTLIAGFVSDVLDPDTTAIPAGLWDFNLWASCNADASHPTVMQAVVYKYDGVNAPTLLSTSEDTTMLVGTTFYTIVISCLLTQTSILTSDRIYVEFRAKASSVHHNITIGFGGATPTHVHTTLPSVGGSGLVKVVNGTYQTPASLLVDVDVASNAAIAQSKISGLSTSLAGKVNTTDVIAISAGGTGQTTAAAALSALGGFPISGGTITDGLTATSGTFTSYLSSPALSGSHYGDGSNLLSIPHHYATCRTLVAQIGTVSGNTFTYTASGVLASIDGVVPIVGDIILFTLPSTDSSVFGPWQVTSVGSSVTQATLERPLWYRGVIRSGFLISVSRGSVYTGTIYNLVGSGGDITVNTTLLTPSNGNGNVVIANKANTYTSTQTWAAGSATVAPLKFQSGSLQTTPAAHSIEWDGSSLYATTSAATRTAIPSFIAGPLSATGSVPALSSTSGIAGQMAFDTAYLYVCISANTWKRATLNFF